MKEITISKDLKEYLLNEIKDTIVFTNDNSKLVVGLCFNNYLKEEYNIVVLCSVVGLLDRFNIKAVIDYKNNSVLVDNKVVATTLLIGNNVYLEMDLCNINIFKLKIALKTFINIYYNLLTTNQFNKVIDYLNDILIEGHLNNDYSFNIK
ncbi:MAG: hypothetical protein PHH04_08010 [Thomasclavelia sp.]|nr:hypothetical protein [Thomasclavelia sp.]